MAVAVAKTMPAVLRSLFNSPPASSETNTKDSEDAVKTSTESAPTSSRGDRFYSNEQATTISEDLLAFTTKAFSRALTKEKWKELTTSYPQIKDTESFLVAPSMEAGMKEDIKKRHGYTKTKELFAFDDGLVDRQSAFLVVARPLLAALTALDDVHGGKESDSEDVDPDAIKDLLEDALVLLGNAHFRLNTWRQKRFSEFLTEVGKRTLKECIPADKHLFPDKFHAKIKSEHDHSSTNNKLISTPTSKHFSRQPYKRDQPFRPNYRPTDNRIGGKRRWAYGSKSGYQSSKRSKTKGSTSQLPSAKPSSS